MDDAGRRSSGQEGGARRDRLRSALRDNLRRRKAQVRGRAEAGATPEDPAGPDRGPPGTR